jgi:hypothetical protein
MGEQGSEVPQQRERFYPKDFKDSMEEWKIGDMQAFDNAVAQWLVQQGQDISRAQAFKDLAYDGWRDDADATELTIDGGTGKEFRVVLRRLKSPDGSSSILYPVVTGHGGVVGGSPDGSETTGGAIDFDGVGQKWDALADQEEAGQEVDMEAAAEVIRDIYDDMPTLVRALNHANLKAHGLTAQELMGLTKDRSSQPTIPVKKVVVAGRQLTVARQIRGKGDSAKEILVRTQ